MSGIMNTLLLPVTAPLSLLGGGGGSSNPLSFLTNIFGGGGSDGNPFSGLESMFGSGILQLLMPLIIAIVGIELLFKI